MGDARPRGFDCVLKVLQSSCQFVVQYPPQSSPRAHRFTKGPDKNMVRGVRRNLNALMDAQANPALPRPQRLALGSNAESTQFPLVNHNVQQPHELSKQLRSEMNRLRTVEDVDIFNEWFTESDRVKQRGTRRSATILR